MTQSEDRSVAGNDDTWMLFDRQTADGYRLVVLARTGNPMVDEALRQQAVTMVCCRAESALVNDRGMPQHTDRIYSVEDGLANELQSAEARAFHVASVTGDGERRIIYAHEEGLEIQPLLRVFAPQGYSLNAHAPDDREALIALVTPTVLDRQFHGDMDVIANLENEGDDGAIPRKTDFWFYGEKRNLDDLIGDLEPWGFSVDHWLDDPTGVVLTTEMPVNLEAFPETTPVLVGTAETHDTQYDGWETFVVHPTPEPSTPTSAKPRSLLARVFGAKGN